MSKIELRRIAAMGAGCNHAWISNSGAGGDPVFKLNRHMSALPVMHVTCNRCGDRTWLTESQWLSSLQEAYRRRGELLREARDLLRSVPVAEDLVWPREDLFDRIADELKEG